MGEALLDLNAVEGNMLSNSCDPFVTTPHLPFLVAGQI